MLFFQKPDMASSRERHPATCQARFWLFSFSYALGTFPRSYSYAVITGISIQSESGNSSESQRSR